MKDGDVSVILKNVNIKDTGTYECRVKNNNTPPEIITIITLMITGGDKEAGDKDGGDRSALVTLLISLSVVVVSVSAGFLIYRKHKRPSEQISYKPPDTNPLESMDDPAHPDHTISLR